MTKKAVVIFDMDGVISDTQRVNSELESLLMKKYGVEMSADEMIRDYVGIPERAFAEMIFKKHGIEVDLDKFVEEKLTKLTELCRGRIAAIDGALDLIKRLKENGFRIAVASSSKMDFIDLVLSELGVKDKFDSLTSGYEVKLGKPNPDIFLLAAAKLKVFSQDCVVIEDGKNGVIAAKRAGMRCIWLTTQESFGESEFLPDITVRSLKDIQIKDLLIL